MVTYSRRHIFVGVLISGLFLVSMMPAAAQSDLSSDSNGLPSATVSHLPRWRGFNLLNLFNVEKVKPFDESEFKMMHDLGFNFFSGDFGIMDSNRSDVVYEDYEGHKLDRAMLELLQRY